MSLPILLGLGLWGSALNDSAKLGEEARKDRERERAIKELELADQKELRHVAAIQEPVIKEAADGMGPSAVMVGKDAFGTEKEAQGYADKMNTPEARINRQRDALIGQGKAADGMALEKGAIGLDSLRRTAAKVMRDEGVNDFIDANFARAPSVEDVKAGKAGLFDLTGIDKYNAVGADKIPEGTKGRWKVMKLANGRELVDFEAVDPSGNSISGPLSARVFQMIRNQTPLDREKTADTQFKEGREYELRREQLDAQKAYWDKLGAAAETRADKASSGGGKGGSLFDRMDEADKIRLQGLKERATRLETAMANAQANGNWDPQSPSAKQMLAQMADIETQADRIISAYGTKASNKPASDLGLFGNDKPAQAPQGGAGDGSERFRMLRSQLAQVLAERDRQQPGSAEHRRLSADVQALYGEISNLPKKERGAMPAGGGQAPVSATQPAVQESAVPSAQAPASPASSGVLDFLLPTPRAGSAKPQAADIAASQGFQPTATRGNAMFGRGEVLYVNPKTGERRWESSFTK